MKMNINDFNQKASKVVTSLIYSLACLYFIAPTLFEYQF